MIAEEAGSGLTNSESTRPGLGRVPQAAEQPQSTPEMEWLVACAKTFVVPRQRLSVPRRDDIDWSDLVNLAWLHGVVPQLFSLVNERPAEMGAGIAWKTSIRRRFEAHARQCVYLTTELFVVSARLHAKGIRALPFKGPVLSQILYGTFLLRQYNDIDILVSREDAVAAREALQALGYASVDDEQHRMNRVAPVRGYEYNLTRSDGVGLVGLHWRLASFAIDGGGYSQYVSFEDMNLWESRRSVPCGERTLVTPAPEDLLLLLCIHGTKHFWERFCMVLDVGRLLATHPQLNWEVVERKAQKIGAERDLFLGLLLAHRMLDAPLPEDFRTRAGANEAITRWTGRIAHQLMSDPFRFLPFMSDERRFRTALLNLETSKGFWTRSKMYALTLVAYRGMPPRSLDHAFLPLPASLSFLYFFWYAVKWICKYVVAPLEPLERFARVRTQISAAITARRLRSDSEAERISS